MQGDAANSVGAVKYVTFVMSGTKFSALFDTLPAEERDRYRARPSDWVDLLCSTLMQEATGNTVDPQGKVIGQFVTDRLKLAGDERATVLVGDWKRFALDAFDFFRPVNEADRRTRTLPCWTDLPDAAILRPSRSVADAALRSPRFFAPSAPAHPFRPRRFVP